MTTQDQIKSYLYSLPEPKQSEMTELHKMILDLFPDCKLWYFDGTDENNKQVTNPNIGYGELKITYANGKTKDWFKISISGNKSGISVYVLGLADKSYLAKTFGKSIGKASITGYCIKFKSLKDIDMAVLSEALKYGFVN